MVAAVLQHLRIAAVLCRCLCLSVTDCCGSWKILKSSSGLCLNNYGRKFGARQVTTSVTRVCVWPARVVARSWRWCGCFFGAPIILYWSILCVCVYSGVRFGVWHATTTSVFVRVWLVHAEARGWRRGRCMFSALFVSKIISFIYQ